MGPERFLESGMWVIPVVMMILCFVVFRLFSGRHRPFGQNEDNSEGQDSRLEILKKRYARGEISRTEFEEMKSEIS